MAAKISSLAAAGVANNLSDEKYVRYDDPAVESPVADEEGKIQEMMDIIRSTQQKNFAQHRHAFRGTHVKTQAVVKGTLTILPDLPPELAQGIANAENASRPHPIAIRYANEPSFLQDDRAPGPRGCGMKIFDVSGTFLDPVGTETGTQDMTFNNAPLLELGDLNRCLEVFRIRERHFLEPEKIAAEMKKRSDAKLQMAPSQLPNHHFLAYVMYSQSAYRWGDYVAKYALFPTTKLQEELSSQAIEDNSDREQHSIWLREYFKEHDAEFDLRVQLLQSTTNQPVEDTTVPWDETAFPFQTVGKVVIPAGQDSFDSQRRIFWEETMKLNVWYGLEAHRPLGSVNRLRKGVYHASRAFREGTNLTKTRAIKSVDEIP